MEFSFYFLFICNSTSVLLLTQFCAIKKDQLHCWSLMENFIFIFMSSVISSRDFTAMIIFFWFYWNFTQLVLASFCLSSALRHREFRARSISTHIIIRKRLCEKHGLAQFSRQKLAKNLTIPSPRQVLIIFACKSTPYGELSGFYAYLPLKFTFPANLVGCYKNTD